MALLKDHLVAHYKFNENTVGDNAELVTNGSAPADLTGWTQAPGTQWSIVGNKFQCAGNGFNNFLTQDFGAVLGRKYKFSYEVTDNSLVGGTVNNQLRLSSTGSLGSLTLVSGVGTYVHYLTVTREATENNQLRLFLTAVATGGTIDVDNISIKLCAVEDSSGNDHDGCAQQDTFDISVAGKINRAFDFNGTTDYIDVGDIESDVKSIAIWVKPDSVITHTDYLIDLNGTDYITIVNGTVTKNGFAGSTVVISIDGEITPTVTANWHLIILTSTDGFDANALDIGRVSGSGYFGGLADNVMLFDRVLTPLEGRYLYSSGNAGVEEVQDIIELSRTGHSFSSKQEI